MRLDTSKNGLTSLSGTLLGLTLITLVLRLTARYKRAEKFRLDDWMVLSAWESRKSSWATPNPRTKIELVNALHAEVEKTYVALNGLTILTMGLAKLSALFFYRRIFCTAIRDVFNIISAISIGVAIVWTLAFFIFTFLICGTNIGYLSAVGHSASAKCGAIFPYFMGTAISSGCLHYCLADSKGEDALNGIIYFLWLMNKQQIWSLNMSTRRKIAVLGVFSLALVGLASSTARMVITIHLVTQGRAIDDEDAYESNTSWTYFIILEAGLTIIAVNLPSLWYYLSGITPDRVLRSARSIESLYSVRDDSQPSFKGVINSKSSGSGSMHHSDDLNSSFSPAAHPAGRTVETYSMVDLPSRDERLCDDTITPEAGGVHLSRSIEGEEEQV